MVTLADPKPGAEALDVWSDPAKERIGTSATVITFVRTVIAVALGVYAAREQDLGLLIAALGVYWVGDMLDGYVARVRGCETRIGAALDILCDRFCCAVFYVGLMWLEPDLSPAIVIYLAEFMVIDCFLSLAFLAWPVRSPNYFYVIDRPTWLWNWSKPAKAVNSSLFAVLLLVVNEYVGAGWAVTLGTLIASSLLVMKCVSLARLVRIGIPIPSR
ncbi:MAG TPA: CDP-alcohol phosphatidyltransferase family protein [Nocardioidaceae bacterium]|nr:CDP-alcohol phosphatidyltransferase family protein [Nocardioidaceae bacterium]